MARRMAFALGPISIVSWYFAFILGSLPASTPLAFHVSRSTFSLSSLPDDWTFAEHRLSKVPLPWTNLLTYARRSRSSSPPLLPILTFLRPAHCRWCPRFCIISGASAKGAPGSDTSCSDPSPCCSTACSTSLDSVSSSLGWECCLCGRCGVCEVSVPARENRRCVYFILRLILLACSIASRRFGRFSSEHRSIFNLAQPGRLRCLFIFGATFALG